MKIEEFEKTMEKCKEYRKINLLLYYMSIDDDDCSTSYWSNIKIEVQDPHNIEDLKIMLGPKEEKEEDKRMYNILKEFLIQRRIRLKTEIENELQIKLE